MWVILLFAALQHTLKSLFDRPHHQVWQYWHNHSNKLHQIVLLVVFYTIYPPDICPIPIGISIVVTVPSGSTMVIIITSNPSALVVT